MKYTTVGLFLLWNSIALAQEAASGVELSGTVSVEAVDSHQLAQAPRDGSNVDGGFRAVLYPVWKISEHWSISGAVQLYSRPYFYDQFSTQGHGVKGDILQANLSYSQFFHRGSVVIRAGELSSAFGAFLLRYDDAVNPLIDIPLSYGYYYEGVSTLALAGVQADVSLGKFDARAQFVNSSAFNPRSIFARDQYGNWAGGAGYTIRQGFRVGGSTYRGPYLDRQFPFYFPGESPPNQLPATAVGIDASYGQGPWNLYGEWQRFQLDYHVIPNYIQQAGYVEARRTLHPRLYLAARAGYLRSSAGSPYQVYEVAAGYRPSRFELVKLGYEVERSPEIKGASANTLALQFVTTFGPLSASRN
jgi:hypothetical protein